MNLLCVQGLRYVRCLRRPRPFVGRSVFRLGFVLSLISTGLYVAEYEQSVKNDIRITLRQNIETAVLKDNRKYHLIIVHYGKDHDVHNEWVYNAANIDRSRIVWARDMGEEANKELRHYFRDREVWQVDVDPVPNTTRLVNCTNRPGGGIGRHAGLSGILCRKAMRVTQVSPRPLFVPPIR